MANGTVYAYTGLEDAYEAYIAAVATYDAYHYGGNTDVDATTAYNNLMAAMGNIKEWKPATFNATAYHASSVATNGYGNLVWATDDQGDNNTAWTAESSNDGYYHNDHMYGKIALPQATVYAYDGIEGHDAYSPIVYEFYAGGFSRYTGTFYIYAIYTGDGQNITTSDGSSSTDSTTLTQSTNNDADTLAFTTDWLGWNNSASGSIARYNVWPGDVVPDTSSSNYNTSIGYSRETSTRNRNGFSATNLSYAPNSSNSYFFWNTLHYTGHGDTENYYEKVTDLQFVNDHYANDTGYTKRDACDYGLKSYGTQYIINYEPVITYAAESAKAIGNAILTNGIDSYLEGGLSNAINVMDAFTANAVNPNTYTWTTDTVEASVVSCANAIKAAVEGYDTMAITEDGMGYSSIISELTDYANLKELYECNNTYHSDLGYDTNIFTTESYTVFHTAMESVIAFMSGMDEDGFNSDSQAQSLANALAEAAAALEYDYDHHHTDSVWHDDTETERTATLTIAEKATDATCEEKGTVDIYMCNVCKMYFVLTNEETDEFVQLDQYNRETLVYTDALGHDYSDEADSTDPDGYKYIDFTWQGLDGTDVDAITCTATFTCKECGKTTTENCTVTPTGTAATCTEDASYSLSATATITNPRDGEEVTGTATESFTSDALGHSWFNPQFTWSPDYSSCTFSVECLNDEQHNLSGETCDVSYETLDPTCTTDGMTVYTATYTVEDGTIFTDTQEVIHDEEKATGHSWNASTLDFMWDSNNNCLIMVQCKNCQEYAGTVLEFTDDEDVEYGTSGYVTAETVDATCEEDGKTTYMAKGQIIDPFTGNPIELNGETEFSSSYEVTIPSNDGQHVFGTDPEIAGKSATCTENGQKDIYKCSVCENLYVENEDGTYTQVEGANDDAAIIPATGHTLGTTPVYTKAATCTEPGYEYYACVSCSCGDDCDCNKLEVTDASGDPISYCEAVEIPATGHDEHLTHVTAKDATCTKPGNVEYWQCASCEATFTDPYAEEPLDSDDITVPATGHAWPETAEFEWADDYTSCTATITCENGCKKTLEEKLEVVTEENVNGIIVTTDDDGTTYTATATFTDTDAEEAQQAVGPYTDTQFVAAEGHVHQMVHVPAVDATCTSEGNISYYYCETCYKMFSDYAGTTALEEKDIIIGMAPHTIGEEIPQVDATCTEAGVQAHYECSVCGGLFSDEEGKTATTAEELAISATGHTWDASTLDFLWDDAYNCIIMVTCSTEGCGTAAATEVFFSEENTSEMSNVVYKEVTEPTCTEDGTVTYTATGSITDPYSNVAIELDGTKTFTSSKTEPGDEALGHAWDNGVVTKAATCTTDGEMKYTCTRDDCNETYTDTIPATGHTTTHTDAKDPYCVENGTTYAGNIEYWYCTVCEKYFSDEACTVEINQEDTVVAFTNDYHVAGEKEYLYDDLSYVAPTEDTDGSVEWVIKCTVCGEILETGTETIPALNHEHQMVHVQAVDATCTSEGNISYYYCETCYKMFSDYAGTTELEEKDIIIEMVAHKINPVAEVPSTCLATGVDEHYECSVCGALFSDAAGTTATTEEELVLAREQHGYLDYEITETEPATCTTAGYTIYTCKGCGIYSYETITEALGHEYTDTITKAATCTTAGEKTFTCVRNDDSYTETIEATGHTIDYENPVYTVAATCTTDGMAYYQCECNDCTDCNCNSETVTDEDDGTTYNYCEAVEIPAIGNHSYGEPEYTWVADTESATCTATMTCENCGDEITAGDYIITSEVTKEATCTDTGKITYTAKVGFALNDGDSYVQPLASMVTYTTTTDVEIPALGHDWPAESDDSYFEWTVTDEGATCTVTVPCTRDCGTTLTAEATDEDLKIEANYDSDGVTVLSYTATVTFYDDDNNVIATYSDTYVVEVPEHEHILDYDTVEFF